MVKVFTGFDLAAVEGEISTFLSSTKVATSASTTLKSVGAQRTLYVITITYQDKA